MGLDRTMTHSSPVTAPDIVARLRISANACEFTARSKLMQEAAAFIEDRLAQQPVSPVTDFDAQLLPCPFCGKSDLFVEREDFTSSYVMCNDCSARGPAGCQDGDDEETPGKDAAERIWNNRAPQPFGAARSTPRDSVIEECARTAEVYGVGGIVSVIAGNIRALKSVTSTDGHEK
jgi:Lar family restriction alleviation protein